MSKVRIPTQKRSIEKRNRIIQKGFELMCEKGYYNTTTTDIAEYANVSTGIIYQYFNDKKDIFVEGVKNYSNEIVYPMIDILKTNNIKLNDLKNLLSEIIEKFIKIHRLSKNAHEELLAMSHLDTEVACILKNAELNVTKNIVNLFEKHNIIISHPYEKVHIAYNMIDNLCHDIVYHNHKEIDYQEMKQEVINIIANMIKE